MRDFALAWWQCCTRMDAGNLLGTLSSAFENNTNIPPSGLSGPERPNLGISDNHCATGLRHRAHGLDISAED